MAQRVAPSHHERWDGGGYRAGLQGEAIPLEGRIVAISGVFDAPTNERPDKRAWPVEDAIALLKQEAGQHFAPHWVQRVIELMPEILRIRAQWPETETAQGPAPSAGCPPAQQPPGRRGSAAPSFSARRSGLAGG